MKSVTNLFLRKTVISPRLSLSTATYIPKRHYIYSSRSTGMVPMDHPVKGSNNHSPCEAELVGLDTKTNQPFNLQEVQPNLEYNYTHTYVGQKIPGKKIFGVGVDWKNRSVGVVFPGRVPQNNPVNAAINPPQTEDNFDRTVNYNHDLGLFSKIIKRAQQALASNPNLQINELKFKQSFDKDIQIHRSWITVSVNNQEIVSANNEIDMKNFV